MSGNKNICAICKVPATQFCAECKNVFYCTRDHQKKHWKEGHKSNCTAYKIVNSENKETHLIATRNIKQNEVILKEVPLVLGPKYTSLPMCLGCHKRIQGTPGNVYRCSQCNWPMCGKNCQNSSQHKDECKIMTEKDFKADFVYEENQELECYATIAPLRCLLLNLVCKSKFKTLKSFKLKDRPKSPVHEKLKTIIVPFIQDILKLDFTEEEILEVTSIFESYSFEILREDGDIKIQGLYAIASLLTHNCVPNTKYSFHGKDFKLVLIATTPIAKGETIVTSYAENLWGTLARREYLKESKWIDCCCKRCSDNTELDTYLGAIFCSKCKQTNEEVCPKIVSTDPLDPSADWKCEKCEHTIGGRQMVWGNNAIKDEISRMNKKNPLNLEQFLVKYKETLHGKNYHALVIKYALTQMYGNIPGYELSDLTDEIIERKIDLCHELLEIIEVLEPGYSRTRGTLLYDLQGAMVAQIKREFNEGKLTEESVKPSLFECFVILKEATEILSTEPNMKEFLHEKLGILAKELEF